MGRVYFPKDELARFGLSIDDILSLAKTERLIEFLKFQVQRARRYYQEAVKGLAMIHKEVRLVIALALSVYGEILKKIEENGYEVFNKRAYVDNTRKIILYLQLVFFGCPQPSR
jgi:phytoene synthase